MYSAEQPNNRFPGWVDCVLFLQLSFSPPPLPQCPSIVLLQSTSPQGLPICEGKGAVILTFSKIINSPPFLAVLRQVQVLRFYTNSALPLRQSYSLKKGKKERKVGREEMF